MVLFTFQNASSRMIIAKRLLSVVIRILTGSANEFSIVWHQA